MDGYGGMIMSSWLDRPLSVAGRVLVRTPDGVKSRLIAPDRALLCIPSQAIHQNRGVNDGYKVNPQVDLQPVYGMAGADLADVLTAEAAVCPRADVLSYDLVLCVRQQAVRVGLHGEWFMAPRIDDLECAYTTLRGFLAGRGEEPGRADVWAMFDNEEVGSSSRQGAQGTFLADVMARIEESLGLTAEQSVRARAGSLLLSADNGHAVHPNHPEKSDPAYIVANGRTQIFSQSVQIVSLEAVEAQEVPVGHEVERTAHVASVGLLRAESSHAYHQVTTAAHRHRNLPRHPTQLGQHRRINVRQGIRSKIGLTYRIRADKL